MAYIPDSTAEGEGRDNRRERRWSIPVPVYVKGTDTAGNPFDEETVTTDVSPSGMCVLLTLTMKEGERVRISAPEEGFESEATVEHVSALGYGMNRLRVRFPRDTKFDRSAAPKKYVYDFLMNDWVGYMLEGVYYNTKHEAFGKIEGSKILSLDTGKELFVVRQGRVYDTRGTCIGHII